MKSKLTVAIPCHNYREYVLEAVHSAEQFTNDIVIFDDGSKDGSIDSIMKSGHHYFISTENHGSPAYFLNKMIDEAEGEYLFVLDADNVMLGVPELRGDYVFGDNLIVDKDLRTTGRWSYGDRPTTSEGALALFLDKRIMPISSFGFYRIQFLRDFGFRFTEFESTHMGFDFKSMIEFLQLRPEIHYAPMDIVAFRQHDRNQSVGNRTAERERAKMNADVAKYILDNPGLVEYTKPIDNRK